MKLIFAVIRPKKWVAVRESLSEIDVERLTVTDALCYAEPEGESEIGSPIDGSDLTPYVFVEIIVNDDFLDRTIEMIEKVARTGTNETFGDGKIFVLPLEQAIRIKDGFRGKGAV